MGAELPSAWDTHPSGVTEVHMVWAGRVKALWLWCGPQDREGRVSKAAGSSALLQHLPSSQLPVLVLTSPDLMHLMQR